MGGRSSDFKYNYQTGETQSQNLKVTPLIDNDKDSISERNNWLIDELQNKNHIICCSTDKFNNMIVNENYKKLIEITNKFPSITQYLKSKELLIRGAKFDKSNVAACFSYKPGETDNMQIFLGEKVNTGDKQLLEDNLKQTVKNQFWSQSDDNQLLNHTIVHEYGHFIQTLIINKKLRADKNFENMDYIQKKQYFNNEALKCKNAILKIQNEKFGTNENFISKYGSTNSKEFFAEAFANLMTTSKPTNLAKSLEIYIKENL